MASKKKQSREARWNKAVSDAQDALRVVEEKRDKFIEDIAGDIGKVNEHLSILESIKEEYEEWQGNLPENLSGSALGEKLEAVTQISFDEMDAPADGGEVLDLNTVREALDEAEGIDHPKGFGRD